MNLPEKHYYEFGPFRLDVAERQLLRLGQEVPLTPKAQVTGGSDRNRHTL